MGAQSAPGGFRRLRGAHLRLGQDVLRRLTNLRVCRHHQMRTSFLVHVFLSIFVGPISLAFSRPKTELRFRGGGHHHGRLGQEHPPHIYSVHSSRRSPWRALSSLLLLFLVFWAPPRKQEEKIMTFCHRTLSQSEQGHARSREPLFQSLRHPTGRGERGGAGVDPAKAHRLQADLISDQRIQGIKEEEVHV